MEIRLIQKGDRGLLISNKKLLFPDRSWKDARVGFAYNLEVVLDKETYAFVKGTMLKTEPICGDDLMSVDGTWYRFGVLDDDSQFILEYDARCASKVNNGYRLFVKVKWDSCTSIETVTIPYRGREVIEYLVERSTELKKSELVRSRCNELNFEDDYTYAFEMFKLLRKIFSDGKTYGSMTNLEIRVFESRLTLVKHHYSYVGDMIDIYGYVGEVGTGHFEELQGFGRVEINKLWEQSSELDLNEISDFAMEYKVCVGTGRLDRCFDDRLSCVTFSALESGITVYAFNMNGYGAEWFETEEAKPYIDLVYESFERLEYFKKQVCKKAGSKSLELISKMNVRKWLVPIEIGGSST